MARDIRVLKTTGLLPDERRRAADRLLGTTARDRYQVVGYSSNQNQPISDGLITLVQVAINNLLTTPGTDRLNPSRGGGLLALCRGVRVYQSEIASEIADRVKSVEDYMLQEQQGRFTDPASQLQSLTVVDVGRGATPDSIIIRIEVRSLAGDTAQVDL